MANWLWLGSAILLCLQWIFLHLANVFISPRRQGMALAFLALTAVLPEEAGLTGWFDEISVES